MNATVEEGIIEKITEKALATSPALNQQAALLHKEGAACPKACKRYFRGATASSTEVCQSKKGSCCGKLSNGMCPSRYTLCTTGAGMTTKEELKQELHILEEVLKDAHGKQMEAAAQVENA